MSGLLAFLIFQLVLLIQHSQTKQPNFVFLFADDLGFNDVGWRGSTNIYTPNLDKLRNNRGLELTRFYVQPKCSPTRTSFMTGRYTYKFGMQHDVGLLEFFTCGIDPSINNTFFGERLKLCGGYNNYYLGKWHLGEYKWAYTPIFRGGLDYFKGYLNSQVDYFNFTYEPDDSELSKNYSGIYDWRENKDVIFQYKTDDNYTTFAFGETALEIIQNITAENDATPFSLIVSFETPHSPTHEAPGRFWTDITGHGNIGPGGPFGDPDNEYYDERREYISMVYAMDYYIGAIVDELMNSIVDGEPLWDNTLLFFFSDNGGVISYASNYPLRGAKATNWEGGIRVPAFISGGLLPGRLQGRQFDGLVHITDLYKTVMDYSNISDSDLSLDGVSLRTLLESFPGASQGGLQHDRDRFIITADEADCNATYNGSYICGGIIRDFDKDNSTNATGIWKLVIGTTALDGTGKKFGWGELENQVKVNDYANKTLNLTRQITCDPNDKGYTVPTYNAAFKSTDCAPNMRPCLYKLTDDPCETENKANDSMYAYYLTELMSELQYAYDTQWEPFWYREECNAAPPEDVFDYMVDTGYYRPFASWWTGDNSANKSNTDVYLGVCSPTASPSAEPTMEPTADYCDGCANGIWDMGLDCYNLVDQAVYACRGTFSNGVNDLTARAICEDGYEICPSAVRAGSLGLNASICGSITMDGELYVSQQSSVNNATCSDSGTDDLWGCAADTVTNDVTTIVSGNNSLFGCDDVLVAFLSTTSLLPNGWAVTSDTDELNTVSLSDDTYGGVLCCISPTVSPTTDPTNIPTTAQPSIDPTFDPTMIPSADPTVIPTADPTVIPSTDPTMNPTADPTVIPTADPTIIPTADPTTQPTSIPTYGPTSDPTSVPTMEPTFDPTMDPTKDPTMEPTSDPTGEPTTAMPTMMDSTMMTTEIDTTDILTTTEEPCPVIEFKITIIYIVRLYCDPNTVPCRRRVREANRNALTLTFDLYIEGGEYCFDISLTFKTITTSRRRLLQNDDGSFDVDIELTAKYDNTIQKQVFDANQGLISNDTFAHIFTEELEDLYLEDGLINGTGAITGISVSAPETVVIDDDDECDGKIEGGVAVPIYLMLVLTIIGLCASSFYYVKNTHQRYFGESGNTPWKEVTRKIGVIVYFVVAFEIIDLILCLIFSIVTLTLVGGLGAPAIIATIVGAILLYFRYASFKKLCVHQTDEIEMKLKKVTSDKSGFEYNEEIVARKMDVANLGILLSACQNGPICILALAVGARCEFDGLTITTIAFTALCISLHVGVLIYVRCCIKTSEMDKTKTALQLGAQSHDFESPDDKNKTTAGGDAKETSTLLDKDEDGDDNTAKPDTETAGGEFQD